MEYQVGTKFAYVYHIESNEMKYIFSLAAIALVAYTAWCGAYGPPYDDAYGKLVHAAYMMTEK